MNTHTRPLWPRILSSFLVGAAALGLWSSCVQPAPVNPPRIVVTGTHAVRIGETLTLSAQTTFGTDANYSWESAHTAVATVDEAGVVTGVTVGETAIMVRGLDTGALASHLIVVVPLEAEPGPDAPAVPHYDDWLASPHADPTAEAFRHWDEDGEVPTTCARCHSSQGYVDYLGGDGTAPGTVEAAAPIDSVIGCNTCHDQAANVLSQVTFPSGVTVEGLGPEARCMVCHQGRASTDSVNEALAEATGGFDEPSGELGFSNIHYYPAAATLFAGKARGGYQYEGQIYDVRFRHVPGWDSCVGCHDAHTTKVKFETCGQCHQGVEDRAGAETIRMIASGNQDYDGDGNRSEGIYQEVQGLRSQLLASIQRYGAEKNLFLCYDEHAYPYFFQDTDHDGNCAEEEVTFGNRYQSFTPRLVKATYNYQMVTKDPGGFAHNSKYLIQLMYDSITDLNQGLVVPFDLSALVRNDVGHFDGTGEAARHWDEDEAVSSSCSKCHSGAPGFRFYVEYGGALEVPETDNGLDCATCHSSFGNSFDLVEVSSITFPGGKKVSSEGQDNLCGTCHSGRESAATIDSYIAAQQASGSNLSFRNVHYLPAAGTLFGKGANLGYQYEGKEYAGIMNHMGGTQCTTCHDAVDSSHTFKIEDVWEARCDVCHGDAAGAEDIRMVHTEDYDQDGSTNTTLKEELQGMAEALLEALNENSGTPGICHMPGAYPYFFKDTDGSGGHCDPGEANGGNRFNSWTPALLRAVHNYQISQVEPGAWAHNFAYVGQLLFDSIEDLTAAPPALIRPPSP